MGKTLEYQGHHCRTCWNVALWIGNDEPLYRLAIECLTRETAKGLKPTLARATHRMMLNLPERTPDGYRVSRKAVREALDGLR